MGGKELLSITLTDRELISLSLSALLSRAGFSQNGHLIRATDRVTP